MSSRTASWVAISLAVLLGVGGGVSLGKATSGIAAVPGNGSTVPGNATVVGNDSAVPELNRTGSDTFRIDVGGDAARMVIELNVSMFTDFPGPGTLRFASFGLYRGTRIVGVEIALHYEGAPGVVAFVSDPLKYFTLDVDFDLDISFFGTGLILSGTTREA